MKIFLPIPRTAAAERRAWLYATTAEDRPRPAMRRMVVACLIAAAEVEGYRPPFFKPTEGKPDGSK